MLRLEVAGKEWNEKLVNNIKDYRDDAVKKVDAKILINKVGELNK